MPSSEYFTDHFKEAETKLLQIKLTKHQAKEQKLKLPKHKLKAKNKTVFLS